MTWFRKLGWFIAGDLAAIALIFLLGFALRALNFSGEKHPVLSEILGGPLASVFLPLLIYLLFPATFVRVLAWSTVRIIAILKR
jgi:hypothetical protein